MRARIVRIAVAVILIAAVMCGLAIHVAALDNTFRFEEFEMSIKFPKSFNVITIHSERSDEAFAAVDLDYDETMTAFRAADIYLRAYDPEKLYQISMTVTKDDNTTSVNNYADLTAAERKSIVDTVLSDGSVSSAVEVKRNGNIFVDSERQTSVDGKAVYINLCNTVINGYQIDLFLQKTDEAITAEETKVLSNAAASMSFDHVRRNTGPVFDWWRLLLWVVILAALSVAISFIYKQYNASNKRKLEERRKNRRVTALVAEDEESEPVHAEQQTPMSFEESLGYKDDDEFNDRAVADEMASYDIKVRDKDPNKGIAYFEDEGMGIDDGSDYFDTYFEEPAEKRSWYRRAISAVGSYIRIAVTHTGYFFKNLFQKLFKKH